jgi:hypothetical protein
LRAHPAPRRAPAAAFRRPLPAVARARACLPSDAYIRGYCPPDAALHHRAAAFADLKQASRAPDVSRTIGVDIRPGRERVCYGAGLLEKDRHDRSRP